MPPQKRTPNGASSVADFKKQTTSQVKELPSGLHMELRRVSLQGLMRSGEMPNNLMVIAQRAMSMGEDLTDEEIAELAQDPDKLAEITLLMDVVVVDSAVNPPVHATPRDGVERDSKLLYVDELMDDDKSFIMGFALGGTDDLEQFRSATTTSVAPVSRGPAMARPAQRPARSRR
jgi:hypothetical protein